MNDDERLKRAHEALKRHDARTAPPFRRPVKSAANAPTPRWIFAAPAAGLAMAAAVFLWIASQRSSAPAATGATISTPQAAEVDMAPLDFLLDTPGGSVLAEPPSLGRSVLPGDAR